MAARTTIKKPVVGANLLFNQTAIYGLRVIAVITQKADGVPLRAEELAEATGVPKTYLSKILRKLVTHGILLAQRGHRGGFTLALPPEKITAAAILSAVVPDSKRASGCVFGLRACSSIHPCLLHSRWESLETLFRNWAESTTFEQDFGTPHRSRSRRKTITHASIT